jgi:hypothetical protein
LPAYASDGSQLTTNFVDQIKVAPLEYTTPSIDKALSHHLGDQIALIGYALDRSVVKPGESIRLRLYWKAMQRPAADYTVFAQVRAGNDQIVAQKDSPPQAGAYPTSFWDAGEIVIDDRVIEIPSNAPLGSYPIKIGMYLPADDTRLPIDGNAAVTEVNLPVEIEIQ